MSTLLRLIARWMRPAHEGTQLPSASSLAYLPSSTVVALSNGDLKRAGGGPGGSPTL